MAKVTTKDICAVEGCLCLVDLKCDSCGAGVCGHHKDYGCHHLDLKAKARELDRVQARQRMRKLREGGSTLADRARMYATRKVIDAHRSEFEEHRRRYLGEFDDNG